MQGKLEDIEKELENVRQAAVAAHIAGDKARAECLTGKAVGIKSTLDIAQRALRTSGSPGAVGELEGMERAINLLRPLERC